MDTEDPITFAFLEEEHVPLLHRWLNGGAALEWYAWGATGTVEQVREHFLKPAPESGPISFLVRCGAEAVGYLERYRLADFPEYRRSLSGRPGDYGVDLFLGRDDLLGRELGGRILEEALDRLVFSDPEAGRCLLATNPRNARAIRCFEKCGFRHERTIPGKNDGHIMVLGRPEWE